MVDSPSSSEAGSAPTVQPPTDIPAAQVHPLPAFPYYGHPNWQGHPWPLNGYHYSATYHQQFTQQHPHQPTQFRQYQPPTQAYSHAPSSARPSAQLPPQKPPAKRKARPRTPSPSPPPKEFPRHWDAALKAFFLTVGLSQCLAGLEADILVMSPDWERKVVPEALGDLQSSISRLLNPQANSTGTPDRPLEERKLDYVHVEKGAEALSPAAINKSISELLARNRARNDASNRAEFLHQRHHPSNVSEVRLEGEGDEVESASCARSDAKTVDRDVMMKFDIAKNEEGPLRGTLKLEVKKERDRPTDKSVDGDNSVTVDRHPGLDERLKNLETHLAMRYVPSPPASLLHRIKFIEDHIMQLEREYPPWAALHFNQPRRGWPPPPRPTPVIVPSHLMSNPTADPLPGSSSVAESSISPAPTTYSGKAVTEVRTKGRASRSSLHRAVLEKLEVQRAIEDLKGEGEHG
ncbi:hypothetical protein BJV78DRAFT_1170103 [Lactifluus subvellereus]|nr:hypothetical protein BJV78DRAFT_1170103 [Lactifluus subvellereus]